MPDEKSRLVYSTDRAVPRKEKRAGDDIREVAEPAPQRVVVRLERKGRGGKSVTVIAGLHMAPGQRQTLLKRLKSALGTGGTVRECTIEIQGDHRDALVDALTQLGYKPRRSG